MAFPGHIHLLLFLKNIRIFLFSKSGIDLIVLFVCFYALCPSQQFLGHLVTISRLPGLNQY